ncbi:MAG: IclR family transcriptional regulator [Herminiimonas sp.]|nr:IclR family transcriptional regulator [Herminiimonas sp.]
MNKESKMTNEKMNDSVRAVGRALDILSAFTVTDYELSVSELLKRVDLSRPTLYRLLYTLEESGFLISVGEPQKFRLGPSVAHLAHVWTSSLNLADVAKPILRNLWEQTGETVALFVPQGAYRTCIAELPSSQPLSFKRGIGHRERIILGASGHAILAHADISTEELHQYAKGTNVDLSKYVKELEMIRKRGYAISIEELIQGAVSIAAPFFNGSGEVAGSIAVFGPKARLNTTRIQEFGKLLIKEAESMSKVLGRKLAT